MEDYCNYLGGQKWSFGVGGDNECGKKWSDLGILSCKADSISNKFGMCVKLINPGSF